MIDWKTKKDPAHWSELCLCLLSLVRRGEVDWSVNRFYFVQASRLHISDKESTNTNRWISVQTLLLCLHWSWLLIWMSVLQSNQLVLTVFSCMRKPVHTTNSDQVKKISQSASFQACTHATLWKVSLVLQQKAKDVPTLNSTAEHFSFFSPFTPESTDVNLWCWIVNETFISLYIIHHTGRRLMQLPF